MTNPEDVIVGKSLEEVEADNTNRVNSPVPGEDRRDDNVPILIPAGGGQLGGQMGTGQAGALGGLPGIFGTEAREDGADTQSRDNDQTSENSEA